jgi:lysophospholipase L1-like esterase
MLALAALIAMNVAVPIDARVVVVGHVATDAGAPVLHWSASEVRARFSGTSIALSLEERKLADDADVLTVFVDGARFDVEAKSGVVPIAMGLPNVAHEIDVVKRSEPLVGDVVVRGFVLDDGANLLDAPKPRARRIEVIGDSLATGYGILGQDPQCPFSSATEDVTKSLAGLVAKQFGADLVDVAWSGRGVVVDIDGKNEDHTVPALWKAAAKLDRAPDVVVIELGSNDLLAKDPPDRARFITAYDALVDDVRKRYAKSEIILATPMAWSTDPNDRVTLTGFEWLNAIVHKRGDMHLSLVRLPGRDDSLGLGCTFHPGPKMHERLANVVVDAIHARMKW